MVKDSLKVTGEVNIKLLDSNGNIKQEIQKSNLVVTTGKQFITSRLVSNTSLPMNHMAIGHGTNPATLGDAQLSSESGNGRVSIATPTISGSTLTFTGIFPGTYGEGAITEAGIFNSNAGGTMLCRTVFPAVQKEQDDTIAISWAITIN